MKIIKNYKKYIYISSILIIIIFFFNFKFELLYQTLTLLNFSEREARKISLSIAERPLEIIINKFNNIIYKFKEKEEELKLSLEIKKGFIKHNPSFFTF